MNDVILSPQTIALVGGLMTALATALSVVCGALVYVCRQYVKVWERLLAERELRVEAYGLLLVERDRVLAERDARMIDLWRSAEGTEIQVTTLTAANDRLTRIAADATEGWKEQATQTRVQAP